MARISDTIRRLSAFPLLVVTGKGGVGKSAVSAVLARLLAVRQRVFLMEVDPRENLHHLLDVPPTGGEPVAVGRNLTLQNLKPRDVMDELVQERLKIGPLVRRVLAHPVYHHFAEGAPGLKETAVLGKALRLLEGHVPRRVPVPDTVIIDAPATGHGVSLLQAPQLVAEVVSSGPVGHMAEQIAAMVGDPRRTGVVLVAAAEEMPVQEALELIETMGARLGRGPELVVVNGMYPPVPPGERGCDPAADPACSLWQQRRRINEEQLERLLRHHDGVVAELPLLPVDRGPELVQRLADELERSLRFASAEVP